MATVKRQPDPSQASLFEFLDEPQEDRGGSNPPEPPAQTEKGGGSNPPEPPAQTEKGGGSNPPEPPDEEWLLPLGPGRLALISPDAIFDRATPELLLNLLEDRRIERKTAGCQARLVGDYICMWANTPPDGGLIVVGMEDDGAFTGCATRTVPHLNELEAAAIVFCPSARLQTKRVPVLRTKDGVEDFVLLFRVYHCETGVTENTKGESFYRVGDRKEKIPDAIKRELQNDRGEISFEAEPSRLTYPDDFDMDLVRHFCANVQRLDTLTMGHSLEEVLELKHLGRRRAGHFLPNVACELLLANDPALHFPGAKVRFFRFDGEEEGTGERFNAV